MDDYPKQYSMEVLVVVATPLMQSRVSEEAWDQEVLNAVSSAVNADQTLEILAVRELQYEDCEWVFEGGMPLPDYDVTVFQDGSWHSGLDPYQVEHAAMGDNLQSLFAYLVEKGILRK
ncbi:MAG: hypothetical protein ACYC3X_14275 [Pirellulaceae bacterium]